MSTCFLNDDKPLIELVMLLDLFSPRRGGYL